MGIGTLRRIVRDGVTKFEDVTPKEEKPNVFIVTPTSKPKKVKK